VRLAVATPRIRPLAIEKTVTVTPPPAAQRLAREALLVCSFRRWPKRVDRKLVVEIAAGRRVRAWDVHRAFERCGGLALLLGGEPMFREVWKVIP
jgi:hypothetical protein